ncbi:MAG: putative inorganic carbon transporter subunit DabA, partial [Patescibacteria group bacterium]
MSQKYNYQFDEQHLLHALKHYLPTQGPLKDFIHHNTLHAFQDMKFYDAIWKASAIFGYQTTFSLTEYRNLYEIKRIDPTVLTRTILERSGKNEFKKWHSRVFFKEYDRIIEPRVGRLRSEWKRLYPIDLDNAINHS